MEEIFNLPRNRNIDPKARDFVGGYIYEKMGRSGLVITIHDFAHELPIKAFAELLGTPLKVRICKFHGRKCY